MDRVALFDDKLELPRVGFGCASLMARTGRRDSVRLLAAAFDSGITHFDVARSYGYGEAESAVSDFASGRRDEITITTKLGIDPPRRSRRLNLARAAGKQAARFAPGLGRLGRRRAAALVSHGKFDLASARASFETSLRELGTDHVDLLLLHDCQPEDIDRGLLEFLADRADAGQTRGYGIATDAVSARSILNANPTAPLLVQVPFEPGDPESVLPSPHGLVLHSVLSVGLARAREALNAGADAKEWSQRLGVDVEDPDRLAPLLFRAALAAGPATVLFSSRSTKRIGSNAALRPANDDEIGQLTQFLASAGPVSA